jgi:rubredoxin
MGQCSEMTPERNYSLDVSATHTCPVCGYAGLVDPPWQGSAPSDEICPSCGAHFGYDDAAGGDDRARQEKYAQLHQRWVAAGRPWFSTSRSRPPDWPPDE